jgi:hypothetical protein
MKPSIRQTGLALSVIAGATLAAIAYAADTITQPTSYMKVDITESFNSTMTRMKAAKAAIEAKHRALLEARYDLSNRPAPGAVMSGGKPVQAGVRARLAPGVSWEKLGDMSPSDIREQGVFPPRSCPCRIRTMPKAGWCFPSSISRKS